PRAHAAVPLPDSPPPPALPSFPTRRSSDLSAGIFGERRYSMRVWVQPDALSARGLTVQDVENAIVSRNVEIPASIRSDPRGFRQDRKSTRLNSSHVAISYAVFCLKKKIMNL